MTSDVIIDTLRNENKTKGARYTSNTTMFASKLRFVSPKGYDFTRKYLKLPSKNVVNNIVDHKGFDEGINLEAIKALEIAAKIMTEKERVCCNILKKKSSYSVN